MSEESSIFTTKEIEAIIIALGKGKQMDNESGFTQEEVLVVCAELKEMRTSALLLETVLSGRVAVNLNPDGEVVFQTIPDIR